MPDAIAEPGVYDLPHVDYLAEPSLSHSGARRILPPGCPAKFRYWADHPPEPTPVFDLGHGAHKLILGAGPELVVVDADDWRTKAAREAKAEAHAAGLTPLLVAEHEQIQAMAAALREHPIAGSLFRPGEGWPEASLFWRDLQTGVMLRGRLDWLPERNNGRMILPDYKTTRSADPERLQRAIADYGYHTQGAWYLDGVRALELADDAAFVLVMQEKDPPYLVTVAEPDAAALRIGRYLNRQAIDLYADCLAADAWPGFSDDVELVSLPYYMENRYLEAAL